MQPHEEPERFRWRVILRIRYHSLKFRLITQPLIRRYGKEAACGCIRIFGKNPVLYCLRHGFPDPDE